MQFGKYNYLKDVYQYGLNILFSKYKFNQYASKHKINA